MFHGMKCQAVTLLSILASSAYSTTGIRAQSVPGSVTIQEGNTVVRSHASTNFRVVTDLPVPEATELLVRLETMLELISLYYGPRIRRPIDMYVAQEIDEWPDAWLDRMAPDGIERIRFGHGYTYTQFLDFGSRTVDSAAIVYTNARDGLAQHEAVHAYCMLAFGRTGPVWYREGMAEVGRCWRNDDTAVRASTALLEYVRGTDPKSLRAIVNDSVKADADTDENSVWRWALCHLLGRNENYTQRFKTLGLALLTGQDVNFWDVYGNQSPEIEFEFRFFLKHMEPGYRVDLCSWDWKTAAAVPRRGGARSRIRASLGWQASRATVAAGEEFRFDAAGAWSIDSDHSPLSADGNAAGGGRLVGCVLSDYTLSDEFELGRSGMFVAPVDGSLFLRCRDSWGEVADNHGTINVQIRPGEVRTEERPLR